MATEQVPAKSGWRILVTGAWSVLWLVAPWILGLYLLVFVVTGRWHQAGDTVLALLLWYYATAAESVKAPPTRRELAARDVAECFDAWEHGVTRFGLMQIPWQDFARLSGNLRGALAVFRAAETGNAPEIGAHLPLESAAALLEAREIKRRVREYPRQRDYPHRFAQRRAAALNIDFHDLMKIVEGFEALRSREEERWRCEACGRRVMDFNREHEFVRAYRSDEDDIRFCFECCPQEEAPHG